MIYFHAGCRSVPFGKYKGRAKNKYVAKKEKQPPKIRSEMPPKVSERKGVLDFFWFSPRVSFLCHWRRREEVAKRCQEEEEEEEEEEKMTGEKKPFRKRVKKPSGKTQLAPKRKREGRRSSVKKTRN